MAPTEVFVGYRATGANPLLSERAQQPLFSGALGPSYIIS